MANGFSYRLVKAAAALLFCAGGPFAVPAMAGTPGTAAGAFLKFAPGPRGTGMGEAYSAVADDAYAAWWNPAGLALVEQPEVGATYNSSMESVSHQYVSFAYPLRYGSTLGFNVTRLAVAPFQGYDAKGWKTRSVDSSETAIGAAYGRTLLKDEIERPVLSAGVNLKAVNSRLDNVSATALAADAGALYVLRPSSYWMKKVPAQELRFALDIKNIGTGLKYDKLSFPLPLSATLGAAWLSHPWGAHTLTLSADQTIANDDKYTLGLGVEYCMFQLLSFRAGYRTGQDIGSGVRAGVGFRLAFIDLDYSMSPFGDLGSMHKFGLTMRFGSPRPATRLPETKQRAVTGMMIAPKETIEKLEGYAADYIELARKDIAASRYVSAQSDLDKAFNLEPALKDGPWGSRAARLQTISSRLRLKDTPVREQAMQKDTEQARLAHESMAAYLDAYELKSFLLAHAALGTNIRGDSVFEELLYVLGELTRNNVRREEILPRQALVKEKLKKSARYFYIQQFDLAGRECEEVTLIDEKNPLGWTRLGSAYYMMGDKERSRKAFQKALELSPNDPVVRQFMAAQGWE
ncbi:MAG: PorV/PorQ family protein [Elusimicrobia bacterium]|nr:PorV/PorQ family protein [Elusimicrobiota bacterium]